MSRRVVGSIGAVLVGLLFAVVATSGGVHLWNAPTWDPSLPTMDPIEFDVPIDTVVPIEADEPTGPPPELPGWVEAILRVLLTVGIAALAIAIATWAWRHRPRVSFRGRRQDRADFDVLPDIAAAIVDEAESRRAELLVGAPRNAIVRCWLQLEQDVADVGLQRHPSDTSADFTERVLGRYTVDSDAIHHLATLYREARFSEHELGEPSREAAVVALDRLHRALAAGRRNEASAGAER